MYPSLQKVVDICAILTENLRMSRLQAFSEERRHFMKDSVAVEKGAGKAKKSHHHRSYRKKSFKKGSNATGWLQDKTNNDFKENQAVWAKLCKKILCCLCKCTQRNALTIKGKLKKGDNAEK